MSYERWFGGCIGWMLGGPLGGLLGYVLGKLVEEGGGVKGMLGGQSATNGGGAGAGGQGPSAAADRDNFLFSLLVMSACVIKADGRIMHSEMEYVRRFFRQNFGEAAVSQAEYILRQLFRQNIDVEGCGRQMAQHLNYGQRLQLLSYLVGIARADGSVTADEVRELRRIARAMGLGDADLDSMLNLGAATADEAYKVLEVEASCSDEELRRAYKQQVLKNHPDRVAALGEDIRRAAEEKLKKINEAYGRICKARGIK